MSRISRLAAVGTVLVALAAGGCSAGTGDEKTAAPATPTPTPTAVDETQFTRDGTFQSHINIDGVDFVYTLYPTKSTPRTHEWYPRGAKNFTITLTAYDLDRKIRDKFATKRRVFLDRINITSTTSTGSADEPDTDATDTQPPYALSAQARRITWDPEPLASKRYGMLITSPKGSFELRNQKIGTVDLSTREVTLHISSTVYIQRAAGESSYERHTVEQDVPITIFASEKKTPFTKIPVDAN